MIPSTTLLPAVTQEGTYGQLVELIMAVSEIDGQAAEGLADNLLDRLGLYGPTPNRVDGLCVAMFFDAGPENFGWVQCGKERRDASGDLLHEGCSSAGAGATITGRPWPLTTLRTDATVLESAAPVPHKSPDGARR